MSEYSVLHDIIGLGFKLHFVLRIEHLNTDSNHIHLLTEAVSAEVLSATDKIAEVFLGRYVDAYIDIPALG